MLRVHEREREHLLGQIGVLTETLKKRDGLLREKDQALREMLKEKAQAIKEKDTRIADLTDKLISLL